MARHYSPKDFLRQAQNALLCRYFRSKNILENVDFTAREETDIDEVYDAWEALAPDIRADVEGAFRDIDLLACENGVKAIIEEGTFHGEDLVPVFEPMGGFHDKVFWTFLERREIFDVALQFVNADNLSIRYWRKRINLPRVPAAVDNASKAELKGALSAYFRQREGRGRSCEVNCYKRGQLDYFFAFPEDFARTDMEWERDSLQRRAHKPAFQVVFIFNQTEGTLNTYFEGQTQVARDLALIFGETILKRSIGDESKDASVYDLNILKRRDFRFAYGPASGIERVRVTKLRFTRYVGKKSRITIETGADDDARAIHDLVDQVFATGSDPSGRIPLSLVNVTQVGIEVRFTSDGHRGRNTRTFAIAHPNSCSLKEEGRDLIIRQMLVDSKLEPVRQLAMDLK